MGRLLKHLMASIDENARKDLFDEISELFKAKSGIDFKLTLDDIIVEVKPAPIKTPEEITDEQKENRLSDSLKKYALEGNTKAMKESGYSIDNSI